MSSEESGLQRWARRKAKAQKKRGAAEPAVADENSEQPEQPELRQTVSPPQTADDAAAEPELPDIETLTEESDFSVFMKEGVPPALRTLALRKLWAADPAFNVIDEMVEYGEDYAKATALAGSVQSAWKPGRGYAADEETQQEDQPQDKLAQSPTDESQEAEDIVRDDEAAASADQSGEDVAGTESIDETDRG